MFTQAQAKAAAEKAAADLKLANEQKRRAELIAQHEQAWLAQNGNPAEIPANQKEMIERAVEAQIAQEVEANAAPAAPLTASQADLKEKMSKLSDAFKGGRFAFIGTIFEAAVDFFVKLMPAFQSLLPMLQNITPMLNRAAGGHQEPSDETPVERVQGLVDAGKLDDANDLLQKEDLKLIKDMKKALESDKDAEEFEALEEDLKNYRDELKVLENDLGELTPLKQDETKKVELGQHLEKIKVELKEINEHYEVLQQRVEAAGGALKSLPVIFERMRPILDAHQMLCDSEVAALPKAAAPF